MRKLLISGTVIALLVTAASGQRAISSGDRSTGAKAHPELLAQFGGAYAGPQSAYVRSVGQRIAVQSGLSNSQQDFTITLLNSPVNNAFAVPGGYVYVTRQLLGLMNDEAELASVMGHETGHVAARHSNSRSRTSTVTSIGSLLLGVLTGSSQIAQLAGQAAQLYTLRFSRTQEYQADDLGVTYLAKAGYDPLASSTMLASLAAQSALDARVSNRDANAMPTWASSHPDPASRVSRAAQKGNAAGLRTGTRNRDAFLAAIDGTLYDDDPRQGVVDGRTFRHPDLKLSFTAPEGFVIANGAQAVSITGNGGQAQFTGASYSGDLGRYASAALAATVGAERSQIDPRDIQQTRVNGIEAAVATTRANTRSGEVDVTVFAYEMGSTRAYHFVTLVPAGRGTGAFDAMFRSVRRLSAAEVAAIKPRRIDVVTVGARDTIASLSQRMAYSTYRTERFMTLNALRNGEGLRPGQKVKLVVYG